MDSLRSDTADIRAALSLCCRQLDEAKGTPHTVIPAQEFASKLLVAMRNQNVVLHGQNNDFEDYIEALDSAYAKVESEYYVTMGFIMHSLDVDMSTSTPSESLYGSRGKLLAKDAVLKNVRPWVAYFLTRLPDPASLLEEGYVTFDTFIKAAVCVFHGKLHPYLTQKTLTVASAARWIATEFFSLARPTNFASTRRKRADESCVSQCLCVVCRGDECPVCPASGSRSRLRLRRLAFLHTYVDYQTAVFDPLGDERRLCECIRSTLSI